MRILTAACLVLAAAASHAQPMTGSVTFSGSGGASSKAPLFHVSWAYDRNHAKSFGLRAKPVITLRAPSPFLYGGQVPRIDVEASDAPGRTIKLTLQNARINSARYVLQESNPNLFLVVEALVEYDHVTWQFVGYNSYFDHETSGTTAPTATAVTGPIAGSVGQMPATEQTVVAGVQNPLTLRVSPLAPVESAEWDGRTVKSSESEQVYMLPFVLENSSKQSLQIAWNSATMTLVSEDGTRVNYVQAFASPTTKQSVVQQLPPGEKMSLYTVFIAPKRFRPARLVIEREDKRYELNLGK